MVSRYVPKKSPQPKMVRQEDYGPGHVPSRSQSREDFLLGGGDFREVSWQRRQHRSSGQAGEIAVVTRGIVEDRTLFPETFPRLFLYIGTLYIYLFILYNHHI